MSILFFSNGQHMSTPYENEVSFSWPDLGLSKTDYSARMKEILDFVGESEEIFQARVQHRKKIFARGQEHYYSYNYDQSPQRIILDFDRILPCPVDGHGASQEWMKKNWGCDSNAESVVWYSKHCTFWFETYHGAAIPVFTELHRKFPEVTIRYEWRGLGEYLKGGCEFLAQADWDECDVAMRDTWLIERGLKQKGKMPKLVWEAGKPYNEWLVNYRQ